MLPPELIAKLNECASANFVALRDASLFWQTVFSRIVIAGLLFEGPELVHEMLSIIGNWFPSVETKFPRFNGVISSKRFVEYAKLAAFFGWILIIVGLGGELRTSSRIVDLSARIEECSDAKVTKATLEAGDATKSATTAREEADAAKLASGEALTRAHAAERSLAKAESDAGKAQTAATNALTTATGAAARAGKAEASLGKAEAEAKNAEDSASNALTLAHEARQEAASFESDLARLKQQAADRVLDEYQQEQVKQRVELFLLTPYELAVADTPEATTLLTEIDAAVGSAGWLYKTSENTAFRFIKTLHNGHQVEQISGVKGVEIGLSVALWGKLKPAADALAKALNFEGIPTFVRKLPEDDPSPNNIHIRVGSKP
jgi:hypothetical protein